MDSIYSLIGGHWVNIRIIAAAVYDSAAVYDTTAIDVTGRYLDVACIVIEYRIIGLWIYVLLGRIAVCAVIDVGILRHSFKPATLIRRGGILRLGIILVLSRIIVCVRVSGIIRCPGIALIVSCIMLILRQGTGFSARRSIALSTTARSIAACATGIAATLAPCVELFG